MNFEGGLRADVFTSENDLLLAPEGGRIVVAEGKILVIGRLAASAGSLQIESPVDFGGRPLHNLGQVRGAGRTEAEAVTAGDTPAELFRLPVLAAATIVVDVRIVVASGVSGAAFAVTVRASRGAADSAVSVSTMLSEKSADFAIRSVAVAFAADGSDLVCRVTGLVATRMKWACRVSYIGVKAE